MPGPRKVARIPLFQTDEPRPQRHQLPADATHLHTHMHLSLVDLWFSVPDSNAPLTTREFRLYLDEMSVPTHAIYLGTAHAEDGLALHVFELGADPDHEPAVHKLGDRGYWAACSCGHRTGLAANPDAALALRAEHTDASRS